MSGTSGGAGRDGGSRWGLLGDVRAQSETIGVVLILGMVILGMTAVIGFGSQALDATEERSEIANAEQTMAQFDSKAAQVALGDSAVQSVPFEQQDGSYQVDPSAGHITVIQEGSPIYNTDLGALVYENDETRIAYQGGGVWRKDRSGTAQMISPPEFHYRGETLTLPILKFTADPDAAAGATTAAVTQPSPPGAFQSIYPDGGSRTNPVENGQVKITVQSEYCEGWEEYFRERTEAQIDPCSGGQEVSVTLVTPNLVGNIEPVPNEGNELQPRGMKQDHNVNQFDLTLKRDGHFNNMHWSLHSPSDSGNQKFELHIYSDDKCKGNPGTFDGTLDVSIYYNDGGDKYEGWQKQNIDPSTNPDFTVNCGSGELTVDFTSDTELTYRNIDMTGSDNKWQYGNEIKSQTVPASTTFDQHASDGGRTYNRGSDTETLDFLINHYLSLLAPNFDLVVADGPGGSSRVDEDASTGNFYYDTGGREYITFLHVTENKITVELN